MDKDQCRKLIELYGSYRRLWDAQHPEYTIKGLREDAWKTIGEKMNLSVTNLKKKMDSLLGSYRRERSREKRSHTTGSGRDSVYRSNWYAYECFHFMADKNNVGNTKDTMRNGETQIEETNNKDTENKERGHTQNDAEAESEGQLVVNAEIKNERKEELMQADRETGNTENEGRRKRQKKTVAEVEDQEPENESVSHAFQLLQKCAETLNDPYYTFGQHIANELKKYDLITLAYVKNIINNIIFEADTGRFQRYQIGYPVYNPISELRSFKSSDSSVSVPTPSPNPTTTSSMPTPSSMPSSSIPSAIDN